MYDTHVLQIIIVVGDQLVRMFGRIPEIILTHIYGRGTDISQASKRVSIFLCACQESSKRVPMFDGRLDKS